ncbi:uncharacterized protein VTP21DRAFT_2467 [Calcarisporiella thermophila]|uniref:uncharacterized protein n=1 Tax=Calcarisporiella thermophila TaxID=911321 RepID=UPI0037448768
MDRTTLLIDDVALFWQELGMETSLAILAALALTAAVVTLLFAKLRRGSFKQQQQKQQKSRSARHQRTQSKAEMQLYPLPSPPRLPIFGHVFSTPFVQPEKRFTEWSRALGPLFALDLGPTCRRPMIIVNSAKVAHDLFETRGARYSSRPYFHLWCDIIMPGSRGFLPTPYGDYLRKHRKLAHAGGLGPSTVSKYADVIERETAFLLRNLFLDVKLNGAAAGINPSNRFRHFSMNVMMSVIFGRRAETMEDPEFKDSLRLTQELTALSGPEVMLIDMVPLLKYIPNPIMSKAKRLVALEKKVFKQLVGRVREDIAAAERGEAEMPNCLAAYVVKNGEREGLDELDVEFLCGALLGGGLETVGSTLCWLFAVLVHYPEVQEMAFKELNEVVGRDRLPSLEDEASLPYIKAIVKEILRYRPPAPLAVPHSCNEDDVYNGYFIPKDSILMLNMDAIHFDGTVYKDPYTFDPSRFLDKKDGAPNASRDHWGFGAGRRICIGMHLAERELFLAIARLLWSFRIDSVIGKEVDIHGGEGGLAFAPNPYRVRFIPRDDRLVSVLGSLQA